MNNIEQLRVFQIRIYEITIVKIQIFPSKIIDENKAALFQNVFSVI